MHICHHKQVYLMLLHICDGTNRPVNYIVLNFSLIQYVHKENQVQNNKICWLKTKKLVG